MTGARPLLPRSPPRRSTRAPSTPRSFVYEALRAGAPASAARAERLGALGARCDARLTGVYLAHATARAARDGGALLEVAERIAALGARRYAMEAAVNAASAFVAAGREDSARRAAARARAARAGPERVPAHRRARLHGDRADREGEPAGRAGRQGADNAEIADRLVLSVRTVRRTSTARWGSWASATGATYEPTLKAPLAIGCAGPWLIEMETDAQAGMAAVPDAGGAVDADVVGAAPYRAVG